MKGPFKMKYKHSAFPFKTGDKVPTAGPMDGGTPGDIETPEEAAYRGHSPRGNVTDVLRRRKGSSKKSESFPGQTFWNTIKGDFTESERDAQ